MKVVLLAHTPQPEQTVAAAARLCYSDTGVEELRDAISLERAEQFVEMLDGFGHESPVEHVTFTFGIEGVSRSFLAQVTRHRIASYSVQSQRYVRQDQFVYITPPAIEADPALKAEYQAAMQQSIDAYNRLADALAAKYVPEFLAQGLTEKAARSKAEKKAIEDARYVLPNACETKMVLTMNVRSLRNFFRLRCCNRAQWEIRAVATEMLRLCCKVAPSLFRTAGPSCCCGSCTEGKMSCGKAKEVREKFEVIHNG
ncbi:FAD-dependent thymidylate synthase [Ruminococcus sp.]|uniref:FAD-dependent thymidylate synthase n=1 Tax=Ruminococcus sp. TaxID=41978 RepID=UPI0025CCB1EE|nr:FAD-dependent thymidylate synthase [Ruminococcus sp.]